MIQSRLSETNATQPLRGLGPEERLRGLGPDELQQLKDYLKRLN